MTDKEKIFTILRNLWKEDNELSSEHRICYNRALQDVQIAIDSLPEEPVSEDLEEAANDYAHDIVHNVFDSFKAGAKWQKEQMMRGSADAEVTDIRTYKEENEVDFTLMLEKGVIPYEIEEEVKLIIIKEGEK